MADLFGGTLPIDHAAQLEEVRREIAQRQRVYPRWVADGKLAAATAGRQLDVMRAVVVSLSDLATAQKALASEHRRGMEHAALILTSAGQPKAAATIRAAAAGPLRIGGHDG